VAALAWHAFAWPSPITPAARPSAFAVDSPIAGILSLLGSSIGVPLVALSATSPLLQSWFARLKPARRLIACSHSRTPDRWPGSWAIRS
jgi:hypothetical protein